MRKSLNEWAEFFHQRSNQAGWWPPEHRSDPHFLATKLALIHSETSEVLEGVRKDSYDSHISGRKTEEVEMFDLLHRAFDFAGAREHDLDGAMFDKLAYNARRIDHTLEHRQAAGGKRF